MIHQFQISYSFLNLKKYYEQRQVSMKKKLFYYLCQVVLVLQMGLQVAWAEVYGSGWYRETQFSIAYVDNISRS